MKINEARKIYSSQLREYREQKNLLNKQKQELEQKSKTAGKEEQAVFAKEAAVLELSINALDEKREEYQEYMNKLTEQWTAKANMIVAEQQGEAAKEYVEDLAKIMEVARRLMKGGIVPASDERKLMEYSMELYQAAKNIGALAKEREEYDSLWEEKKRRSRSGRSHGSSRQYRSLCRGAGSGFCGRYGSFGDSEWKQSTINDFETVFIC